MQKRTKSFRYFFAKSKWAFMCLSLRRGFRLVTLPKSPDRWSVAVMVVLWEVLDFGSLHTGNEGVSILSEWTVHAY